MPRHSIIPSSRPQRRSWLGAALLAGTLAGLVPGRAGAECAAGDLLRMTNPVVTVVAGPGDATVEQQRWTNLGDGWLDGNFEITLGNETFAYEAAP